MKPPGKTTLFRMQMAAQNEADRIEISQDARVQAKLISEPMPSQVLLRDDFAGIVRLIDAIMSDKAVMDRIAERLKASSATLDAAAAVDAGDEEIEPA